MRTQQPSENAWPTIALIVAAFVAVTIGIALRYPFPSPFDELAQLSVVRAQFEHPDLFADTRRYLMLDSSAPAQWTDKANYLNHPALYYLGLAPLLQFGDDVVVTRAANVILAVIAMIVTIAAGYRVLSTRFERIIFAVAAISFPKAALIGGMINNDNLALVAAALVFAGLTGAPGATLLIAGGLALAGWTKLTALIALAMVVAAKVLLEGRAAVWSRQTLFAGFGVVIGCLPFLVNFALTGHLFHVNTDVYGVPPDARPVASFAQYLWFFLSEIVSKWPAAEASLPRPVGIVLIHVPMFLAAIGLSVDRRVRTIGLAYLAGTLGTLCVHLAFGWQSFQSIGDQTIAQTRYYNVLWPGIAFAGAAAVAHLRRSRVVVSASLLAYLTPTVIGGVVLALFSA